MGYVSGFGSACEKLVSATCRKTGRKKKSSDQSNQWKLQEEAFPKKWIFRENRYSSTAPEIVPVPFTSVTGRFKGAGAQIVFPLYL